MKAYRKIKAVNSEVAALQSSVEEALNPVLRAELLNGVAITAVAVTVAGVEVEHKLGRPPIGFLITDIDADANVWRTAWNSFTITLDATASATINLWVY